MSEEITHQFPNNGYTVILSRLDSLDSGMVELRHGVAILTDRITTLEDKVERRLMETRPIWEQVLQKIDAMDLRFDRIDRRFDGVEKRLEGVETRLEGVESRLEQVEGRLSKVEYQVYHLGKKIRFLHREIVDDQSAWEDLEERVANLEKPDN